MSFNSAPAGWGNWGEIGLSDDGLFASLGIAIAGRGQQDINAPLVMRSSMTFQLCNFAKRAAI